MTPSYIIMGEEPWSSDSLTLFFSSFHCATFPLTGLRAHLLDGVLERLLHAVDLDQGQGVVPRGPEHRHGGAAHLQGEGVHTAAVLALHQVHLKEGNAKI